MEEKKAFNKKINLIVAFILPVISFLYFHFIVPYHIFFKEQIQLFIFDPTYIISYFSKPGGLACLTGDFLTQFFYLKGGGAIIISLLFLFEWLMFVRILNSFGVKQTASLWALLPVIAEWVVISDINFSIAMTVSFVLTLLATLIYASIQNKMISIVYGIIFIPFLYFLLGSAVFLFPAAILLYDIQKDKKRYIYWFTLIVLTAITPFLFRIFFLLTVNQAFLYPYLGFKQKLSSLVMILILFFVSFKKLRELHFTFLSFSLTVLFILIIGISSIISKTNFQREKTLSLATEAYFNNWDKVLKLSKKAKLENQIAAYYTNLALSKQMQSGERMMEFYQPFVSGLFLPVNTESNWFYIFFSNDVYFHIGDMNMAQHSAILGMTFSPHQRSARLMQRLIEINIVTGDIPAAMKFIRILEASLFHSKNAAKLKEMAFSIEPEKYPLLQKRNLIHTSDTLRGSSNNLLSLELLVQNNPDNQAALDYLLSFHLLTKNIPEFFKIYNTYFKEKTNHVPKVYAEALLIYFAAFNIKPEIIMEYNIDRKLLASFNEYTKLYESTNGNLGLLRRKFPDTYWLFFHFANLKT